MSKKKVVSAIGEPVPAKSKSSKSDDRFYIRDGVKTLRPTSFYSKDGQAPAHHPDVDNYPDGDYKNING